MLKESSWALAAGGVGHWVFPSGWHNCTLVSTSIQNVHLLQQLLKVSSSYTYPPQSCEAQLAETLP